MGFFFWNYWIILFFVFLVVEEDDGDFFVIEVGFFLFFRKLFFVEGEKEFRSLLDVCLYEFVNLFICLWLFFVFGMIRIKDVGRMEGRVVCLGLSRGFCVLFYWVENLLCNVIV